MGDTGYVILLAADAYDVPYKDSGSDECSEESTDQFEYFVCCLCPVKTRRVRSDTLPRRRISAARRLVASSVHQIWASCSRPR